MATQVPAVAIVDAGGGERTLVSAPGCACTHGVQPGTDAGCVIVLRHSINVLRVAAHQQSILILLGGNAEPEVEGFLEAFASDVRNPALIAAPQVRDSSGTQPRDGNKPAGLSDREVEVLRLVAEGHTNQEIADLLVLSVRTVENHIARIYSKIGARGRAEATAFAFRRHLL